MIQEIIHNLFPDYYRDKDTYKDSNGKGLLERFIDTFSVDIDEEMIPKIENLVPSVVNYGGQYERILSEGFGNNHYLFNEELTIKLAKTWFRLNHHKGTTVGLDILLNELLGVEYELIDISNYQTFYYNVGDNYDSGTSFYDHICSEYMKYRINITVAVNPPISTTPPWAVNPNIVLNNEILVPYIIQLVKLINVIQPLNAVLTELWFNSVQQDITGGFNIGFNQSFN